MTLSRWSVSSHVFLAWIRLPGDSGTCGLPWLPFFFSFSHLNFLPILIRSISFLDYPEKIRILVKEITVIGLGEEVEKNTKQGTSQ